MSLRILCRACQGVARREWVPSSFRSSSLIHGDKFSPITILPARTVYIISEDSSTTKNETKHDHIAMDEVNKFRRLAGEWWNETGDLEALHTLNKLRVPLIRDGLLQERGVVSTGPQPLKGFEILDVGCGGGILSEPLARLGASVTGVDLAEELLDMAELHSLHDPLVSENVKYICGSIEEVAAAKKEQFDAVVASEVLEHVTDLGAFLGTCCDLVKPGGSLFVTSINKTALAYAVAVVAAESLNIVPKGSHEWDKLVSLKELQHLMEKNGFVVRLVHGSIYNPVSKKWSWIPSTSCTYAMHAVKADHPSVKTEDHTEATQTKSDENIQTG